MPYWNFEYTKAVIYTVVKVGGGIGQDPATEVTHLRLNQSPVFFQCSFYSYRWSAQYMPLLFNCQTTQLRCSAWGKPVSFS